MHPMERIAEDLRIMAGAMRETARLMENGGAVELTNVAAYLEAKAVSAPRWPWIQRWVITMKLRRLKHHLSAVGHSLDRVQNTVRWIAHLGVSGSR